MKTKLCLLLVLLGGATAALGQGTAFTYSGRLNAGTNVANGSYDLTFALFTFGPGTGGSQAGVTLTNNATTVSNGLFMVTLDFGANFPGAARWLEIGVRTNGNGGFTTLSPRQAITAAPYAITAGNVTGVVPNAGLAGTYGGAVTLNNVGNSFTGSGAGLTALNANNISSGTLADSRLSPNVALLNLSDTFSGQIVANGGVRIAQTNLWFRGDNNHGLGWYGAGRPFAGSTLVDGPVLFGFNGGALGTERSGTEQLSLFWNASGYVGIGTTSPDRPLTIKAAGSELLSLKDSGGTTRWHVNLQNGGLNFAQTLIADFRIFLGTNGAVGIGTGTPQDGILDVEGDVHINDHDLFLRAGTDHGHGLGYRASVLGQGLDGPFLYGFSGGMLGGSQPDTLALRWTYAGDVGIGTMSPASKLDVAGQARAQGVLSTADAPLGSSTPSSKFAFASAYSEGTFLNWNGTGNDAGCRRLVGAEDYHAGYGVAFGPGIASPVMWMYDGSGNAFEVRKVSFGQPVPNGQKLFAVHADGTTEVQVLQITGGSDVAEPFRMTEADIPQGALVVIDEEHPGQLQLAREAYDHRVAGIVSGANGIQPGVTLHQEGRLEGGKNVALSGRVYALADAMNGAIKPGDLLTSSATPGHVMKSTDSAKAQGAIVGKAMSALKEGRGLVLVLVSLQ